MVATYTALQSAGEAVAYYDEDDYYLRDQAPTEWHGKLAEMLGLKGEVDRETFSNLLNGILPDGTKIHPGATGVHRPGGDWTLSAPKPYSILAMKLAAQGDDRLLKLFHSSAGKALDEVEKEVKCRHTKNGETKDVTTGNMIFARVTHLMARPVKGQSDINLHEHGIAIALTKNPINGQVHAAENENFYHLQKYAGAILHAELARGLREMGYSPTGFLNNGIFDIAEVPQALCEEMSRRTREQAAEWYRLNGVDPETATPAQHELAMRHNRERKVADIDHAKWMTEQLERIGESGYEIGAPSHDYEAVTDSSQQIAAQVAVHESMRHNLQMTSLVERHQLIADALKFAEGKTSFAAVNKAIDEVGLVRGEHNNKVHYTTKAAQAADRAMLRHLDETRGTLQQLMNRLQAAEKLNTVIAADRLIAFDAAIAAGKSETQARIESERLNLTEGQREGIIRIATTADPVLILNGVAGVGKTTLLRYLKPLLEAHGYKLVGSAPTHQAKNEMRDVIGEGTTLANLLASPKLQEQLGPKHVLVPDESSMLTSADMSKLLRLQKETQCRIAPIGDWRQLPAVEAGSPFMLMQRHLGQEDVLDMKESVRHIDPTLKAAMILANDGHTDEAIDMLMSDTSGKNRIIEVKASEDRYRLAAQTYFEMRANDATSFITTGTNKARLAINEMVREQLGLAGQGQKFTILEEPKRSAVELRKIGSYQKDDLLLFRAEYKRLHANKGDVLRVHVVKSDHLILSDQQGNLRTFRPNSLPPKAESEFNFKLAREVPSIEFSVGDEVRFRDTDVKAGYANGDNGKVVSIENDHVVVEKDGKQLDFDGRSPVPLAHAYCLTVNGAQGSSRDLPIGEFHGRSTTTNMNSFIVQTSRARHGITLIVDDIGRFREAVRHAIDKPNAIDLKQSQETPDRMLPEASREIDLEIPPLPAERETPSIERTTPAPGTVERVLQAAPTRERDHGLEMG